jgi:hypothetical protein
VDGHKREQSRTPASADEDLLVLELLQVLIDSADGLPALQGRRRGFPAHELVPEVPALEVL